MARNQGGAIWKIESLKRFKIANWLLTLTILITTNLLNAGYSYAQNITDAQRDNYKLYAHMQLLKASEYECFDQLIFRESRWNPFADNGNHWGLGQGANKTLKHMDAYQQIDWFIKYAKKRYGTMCKALAHSKSKGYY